MEPVLQRFGALTFPTAPRKKSRFAVACFNDVDDIEKFYPGTVSGIREWFRWYKTPDGKPINAFGHGEKALSAKEAVHVIEETNGFYKDLMAGKADAGKLWTK